MSSDNRTPRLHSFRIACAIASAAPLRHRHRTSGVLLKASNRSARQPCDCRLPRVSSPCDLDIGPCRHRYRYDHPQRRSRVDDQERRPLQERVCDMLKVLGILFVVQAATSLYAGSLETSRFDVWRQGRRRQEIASSFDWTSLVLGIVLFMLSQLFLYARELYLDSDEIA